MATHSFKKVDPNSITTSGPVTYFVPTADPKVTDADGNQKEPGLDALEEQRRQFAEAEKVEANLAENEEVQEKADIVRAASEVAAAENISVKEAKENITQAREEDKKVVAEVKGEKAKAVEKAKAGPAPASTTSPPPDGADKEKVAFGKLTGK